MCGGFSFLVGIHRFFTCDGPGLASMDNQAIMCVNLFWPFAKSLCLYMCVRACVWACRFFSCHQYSLKSSGSLTLAYYKCHWVVGRIVSVVVLYADTVPPLTFSAPLLSPLPPLFLCPLLSACLSTLISQQLSPFSYPIISLLLHPHSFLLSLIPPTHLSSLHLNSSFSSSLSPLSRCPSFFQ